MKITIAQLNFKVGDIKSNLSKIINSYKKAEQEKADIIIYPELTTIGYQPLDLLNNKKLIEENIKAIKEFKLLVKDTAALVDFVDINNNKGKKLFNSCCFLHNKKIIKKFNKKLLPTYDIFDEKRYFQEGNTSNLFTFKGKKLLITICEDIWANTQLLPDINLYKENIIEKLNADLIINLSASPYYYGKTELRKKILSQISKEKKADIVYVNTVGANDNLIFDGTSMYISKNKVYQLSSFKEEITTLDSEKIQYNEMKEDISYLYNAIVLGIKDYFEKQGFKKAVIGLSGGIDSSVVASLAVEALGSENILAILMPSRFSSKQSLTDAIELAKNLNIKYGIKPIEKIFKSYIHSLNLNLKEIDLTIQNLQSRIRGNILMSYSNKYGCLVLTTSNKSEIAMGYFTLYGDSCGAMAPIADLVKEDVYNLAKYINKKSNIIPYSIIKRPPTAELKPNQKDEDDLPKYKILDKIVKLYIEEELSTEEITKEIKNKELVKNVINRIEKNEYKRKQLPLLLKLSKKAFDYGRKMPIVKQIII